LDRNGDLGMFNNLQMGILLGRKDGYYAPIGLTPKSFLFPVSPLVPGK
jgi:hypothetical protein